jgi:cell division protease FtsH
MSEVLGPITFGRRQEQVFLGRDISRDRNYSEEVASAIDKEVRRMIEDAYKKTEEMLKTNIAKLHLIAQALLERETLEAEQLDQLLKDGKITDSDNVADSDNPALVAPLSETVETLQQQAEETKPKIVYIR